MADGDYVEPLSGEEIVTDVCNQLAESLRRDCNLRESDAYEGGYSARIKATIQLYGMDTMTVEVEVPIGKPQENPDRVVDTEFDIPVETALNVVRERSEQPVPTLTQLETGEAIVRPRRYVRREKMVAGGATGESL